MRYRRDKKYRIPADWTEEDGWITVLFCLPNSRDWRGLITAHIEWLTYGRIWDEQTGIITDVQSVGREIFNSMAMCDIETQLTRIADSLESLDSKAGQIITLDNLLDELAEGIGLAHPLYILLNAIASMLPNLRFTVDVTDWLKAILEIITWRMPVLSFLAAMSSSLAIIAAATVGTGVQLLLHNAIMGFRNASNIMLRVAGLFFGGFDIWTDWLSPLLSIFTPDSEGGTGGVDPDNDPKLRTAVNISVNSIINACCSGLPSLPQLTVPNTRVTEVDQVDNVSPSVDAIDTEGITWGGATSGSQKCQTAHYIITVVHSFLSNVVSRITDSNFSGPAITTVLVAAIASMSLTFVIPVVGLIGMAAVIATIAWGATIRQALDNIITAILIRQDDLVCEMYNSSDVGDARVRVHAILLDELTSVEATIASYLFNNSLLTALFYANPGFNISGFPSDCSSCPSACDIILNYGNGPDPQAGQGTWTSEKINNANHTVRFDFIACGAHQAIVSGYSWTGVSGSRLEAQYFDTNGNNHIVNLLTEAMPFSVAIDGNAFFWVTASLAPAGNEHPFSVTLEFEELF